MNLLHNQGPIQQTITAYGEKSITINETVYFQSLLILPGAAPVPWVVTDFDKLKRDDFNPVFAEKPDLLLIGSGMQHRFLPPRLLAEIASEKTGVEYMSTPAACRTFNLLLSEGRRVALALFMEGPA